MPKKAKAAAKKAAASASFKRAWYYDQIDQLNADTVTIDRVANYVSYHAEIRSDESHIKTADPEEVVHGLIIGLLCSPRYRYPKNAVWHEKYYVHGSKGSNADEVDILVEDADMGALQ